MKHNRILAVLCAVSLCCMYICVPIQSFAEEVAAPVDPIPMEAPPEQSQELSQDPPEELPQEPAAELPQEPTAELPQEPTAELPQEPAPQTPDGAKEEKPQQEKSEAPVETGADSGSKDKADAQEPAGEKTVEEKPTEKPAETPTEKPTAEPTAAPTEKPTEAPTAEPTAEPTEAPTAEPTAEPTEEPTAEPTEEPTPEPTEAPTAEPTEEPTPEPTLEPTPEPTPEPQVDLQGLHPSRAELAPGETVTFLYEAQNAETVIWSADRSDGYFGGSGHSEGNSFNWTPAHSGVYTVTVNATGNGVTVSQSCKVVVRAGALSVNASSPAAYAVAGVREIHYNLSLNGGVEPYAVKIAVKFNGSTIFAANDFMSEVVCGAMGYGEHVLSFDVTDALGASASASVIVLGSNEETNKPPALPRLGKDMIFTERLVAVAKSQVGYHEMETNFGYKENGKVQGWSYYGAWYGMPYEEWCAMFVCYCLEKAGIGGGILPRAANCYRWKRELSPEYYIDDEDEYIPEPGDLIFFHHNREDRNPGDPNFPNHVGIVVDYDPEKDFVYTVEGNSGFKVSERIYSRENEVIVGYASLRRCMVRYDDAYKERVDRKLARDRKSRKKSADKGLAAKTAATKAKTAQ